MVHPDAALARASAPGDGRLERRGRDRLRRSRRRPRTAATPWS